MSLCDTVHQIQRSSAERHTQLTASLLPGNSDQRDVNSLMARLLSPQNKQNLIQLLQKKNHKTKLKGEILATAGCSHLSAPGITVIKEGCGKTCTLCALFIVIKSRYTEKMKNIIKIITISLLTLYLFGCNNNSKEPVKEENFDKDASYAFGMSVGMDMSDYASAAGIVMNVDQFVQGMKDYLSGGKTRLTEEEAIEKLETAFSAIYENLTSEEAQKETAFLAENSKNPGVMITSSGLQYEIISEGEGPKPSYFDTVMVHYTGRFTDGTLFDSSYDYGEPIEFPLYAVIPGWAEGLQLMNVGSTYRFYIPSELGYGPNGIQNIIPPYATLVFEVVLLDIVDEEHT